jgi:hypothetical protein
MNEKSSLFSDLEELDSYILFLEEQRDFLLYDNVRKELLIEDLKKKIDFDR